MKILKFLLSIPVWAVLASISLVLFVFVVALGMVTLCVFAVGSLILGCFYLLDVLDTSEMNNTK